MTFSNAGESGIVLHGTKLTDKFNELFDDLERFSEAEQKQKILEMNELMNEMDKNEIYYILTDKFYNEISRKIETKLTKENAAFLLKQIGFNKILKYPLAYGFEYLPLRENVEKMMIDESKKHLKKKNLFLIDLCECYLMISNDLGDAREKLVEACVSCLLKTALDKKELEKTKEEVEMAMVALSVIPNYKKVKRGLYLNKIVEVIKHHQEHNNLTRLAYQSAWKFLINRLCNDRKLDNLIMNELHFVKEAKRELKELRVCIDWKNKEKEKIGEKRKEMSVVSRWCETIQIYLYNYEWNADYEGFAELVPCIVGLYRSAKNYEDNICKECIYFFGMTKDTDEKSVSAFVENGAAKCVMEEMCRQELEDYMVEKCLHLFTLLLESFKEKIDEGWNKAEWKKIKRELFEKLEEEGYDDVITSYHDVLLFLVQKYDDNTTLSNCADYLMNA